MSLHRFPTCAHARAARRLLPLVAAVASVLTAPRLQADFNEPAVVTDSAGKVTQTTIAHDPGTNSYIASVVDQRLQLDVLSASSSLMLTLPEGTESQGDPDLAVNARGDIFACFTQTDSDPAAVGREVFLLTRTGGQSRPLLNLSDNRVDDSAPHLALGNTGQPHVVWAQSRGDSEDGSTVVYYDHEKGEKTVVDAGAYPALDVPESGVAHLVYTRENDLYYNNNSSGNFDAELRLLNTPDEPEFDASIGVTDGGDVFIAYESFGTLYFLSKPAGGGFTPPRVLDGPGILHAELKVHPSGAISIVYSKQGDIYYILGASSFLLEPVPVLGQPTAAIESHPSLTLDSSGNLHVAFVRQGETYYVNNVGGLEAEFTASPRDGEAPLRVRFQDLSSGEAQLWNWDFGDGTESNVRNPIHTFAEPGIYNVTLTIFNAGQESTIVKEEFILVQEPSNRLRIPDQAVFPNQSGVWFPVIAQHKEGIRGFQLMAVYDPNILTLTSCELRFTETGDMQPEIWDCNFEDFDRRVEIGCVFDFFPPFDHTILPPGNHHNLVNLVFDVSNRAPQGGVTEVQLVNNSQISRIFNLFSLDSESRLPVLESSTVEIVRLSPLPHLFIRGDTDGSGTIELTDAVQILQYLFRGGDDLACPDAGDFHDAGNLTISSAVAILQFLFTGGPPPRVPFPNHGIDPTADLLQPCI